LAVFGRLFFVLMGQLSTVYSVQWQRDHHIKLKRQVKLGITGKQNSPLDRHFPFS